MRFGKYGNVTAMIKLFETFGNNALQGKFIANVLLVRTLETDNNTKRRQEIRLGDINET